MSTLFAEFSHLWPESSRASLEPMLSKIPFFYFPAQKGSIETNRRPQDAIVILRSGTLQDVVKLASLGYSHCIQRDRPDFPQELLASALMLLRPEAFTNNPVPFFFTGFAPTSSVSTETNLSVPFRKTSDKPYLLERLETFLNQSPRLQGISDLCVQVADELISNALFSAPVDFKGISLYQDMDRTSEVMLPENKKATFFSCFSDYRVIVGCEDRFGSFRKNQLLEHLENSFLREKATARSHQSAGAGLGFRYMIENSANFYLYCDKGNRSLVAAGFLLQGLKSNLTSMKHFHLSFI